MSVENLLNLTCTLTAPATTVGTSGGNIVTYSNVATFVPCSIQPERTLEAEVARRETGVTRFVVYFAPDRAVLPQYRITSIAGGDRYAGAWSGKTLAVVSLYEDAVGRGQYRKVLAELVEGGPTG